MKLVGRTVIYWGAIGLAALLMMRSLSLYQEWITVTYPPAWVAFVKCLLLSMALAGRYDWVRSDPVRLALQDAGRIIGLFAVGIQLYAWVRFGGGLRSLPPDLGWFALGVAGAISGMLLYLHIADSRR